MVWQHHQSILVRTSTYPSILKTQSATNTTSVKLMTLTDTTTSTEREQPVTNASPARYIIYECNKNGLCGGWGDRLKGIVSSYLISLITNRTFGISITAPACNLTDYFEPHLIDWNIDLDRLKNLPSKRISHMDNGLFFRTADTKNFSALMKETVIYYRQNYEFIPRLQESDFHASDFLWMKKWTRDRVFAHVMRILFKLKKRLKTVLIDFINKAKPNKKWKLMCAHIRLGRNPTIPNDSEQRNNNETIKVIWDFITKNFTCDLCKIFLATDSEVVRQKAKSLFPDKIVDIPGDIVHIERGQMKNKCDAFSKVILDQQVLSKCDSLLITKSNFGKIAAYLRGTEENLFCSANKQIVKCLPNNINTLFGMSG
ncbi:uncharacterized protein LOC121383787 [Gigantopelta aegis]|uniref:uncharacterized protein LOC121383787 n=1 Tax=Gigantopelta aegis TaxID=1735272 RepID=UPI001B88C7F5|nr:uncharacterized protein LOC121383787 [Gigantopelta aegis]